MSDFNAIDQSAERHFDKPSSFSVEDTYWGYIVKSGRRASTGILLAQVVSFFLGTCFLTAAIGMLAMPTMLFDGDLGPMRLGVAVIFASLSFYMLWFASRGSKSELHVDTSVGEIREVISNRAGRPTTVGCYGFDTIGGIFMDQSVSDHLATLVLRYRNTAQTVCVAEGIEAQLVPLRDRLALDLMVVPSVINSRAA